MGDLCASRRAERGQTLPLLAVALVAVLGFAGLALDGSRLYLEHSRVQAAADAGAIGAAHELSRGHDRYAADLLRAATRDVGLHGFEAQEPEVVLHHPPVSGARAGSPRHVEVVVRTELRTTFMGMFGRNSQPVSGRAVAGLAAEAQPCLVALADTGPGALSVEGSQPLQVECGVAVASNDAEAWRSGEACVAVSGGVALAGGLSGACIGGDVSPSRSSRVVDERLAALRMPDCKGRAPGAADRAEGGMALYWPGCHEEPVEIASGRAQLMPGVHIFLQGLRIRGGVVAGREVTLLFPASGVQRGVAIAAAAAVELGAPARGELAGVLMFAEPGGAGGDPALERDAGSALQGELYFPGRTLRWAPNPAGTDAWTRAVADRIVLLDGPSGRAIVGPPSGSAYRVVLAE